MRFGRSIATLLGAIALPALALAEQALPDIDVVTDAPAAAPRRVAPARRHVEEAPAPVRRAAARAPTRVVRRTVAPRPAPVAAPQPAAPVAPVASVPNVIDSAPANNTRIDAATIARTLSPSSAETLNRVAPSVDIQSSSGNSLQPDVSYRGFLASPVEGTPQGLAVYQNGVRVNESFGDTVHWDQIPTIALLSMDLINNNPAFGLNALGGAVNLRMKDGFNTQGGKIDVMGGSYGRLQGAMDFGKQVGNWGFYAALEGVHDDGFRRLSSSNISRFYGDLGYRAEGNELHLDLGLSSNRLGATGPAPIELLQQSWSNVYSSPQTNSRDMGMVNLTGRFDLSPTWTLTANAYVRRFDDRIVDGNPTDAVACDPAGPNPTLVCYGDPTGAPAVDVTGKTIALGQIPNSGVLPLGEIDRSVIRTTSEGGSVQLSNGDRLFGFKNHFSIGASFDFGQTNYSASAELGVVEPNFAVQGSGVFLGPNASANGVIGPVNLNTINRYAGLYALDAFEFSDKLTVSAGARLNYASISLDDMLGGALSGNHDYTHVNPLIGLTYKITPELQAYGSYAEANRAPTPLELGCSDPANPCVIGSFLVADPSLKQVISRTYEAGLRGQHAFSEGWGALGWKLGVFQTRTQNDILNIQNPNSPNGAGYFANVGDTRRQGVETSLAYRNGPWDLHASYAYIDATYQSTVNIGSFSPTATNNGTGIDTATPGDQLPMVPRHRVKINVDYDINSRAKIGADFLFTGPQRFVGDASNTQPQLPSYWTVSLNGSYKLRDDLEIYGLVTNLFNRRYSLYGTYFDTTALPFNGGAFSDARSVTPAQPLSVYAGLRYTFDTPKKAAETVADRY